MYHDITYDSTITVAESELEIKITTDTPYYALTATYGVSIVGIWVKKWPRYNDTVLYKAGCHLTHTTDLQRGYTASSNEFGNKTNIVHWHGFQKVYRHLRFKMLCEYDIDYAEYQLVIKIIDI